jgi:hypothetical protein
MSVANDDQTAERLRMAAYLSLDVSDASVVRCGRFVIKLRENPGGLPLWLELVEERPIDGAGFQEIADGVPHLLSSFAPGLARGV